MEISSLNENKPVVEEINDVKSLVLPSVDVDQKDDLNLRGSISKLGDRLQRRKRPRRKGKRGKYPYDKLTWQQRREQDSNERAFRVREEMFAHGQPVAPYNTTQFLIEDHGDAQDIDAQLQANQVQCSSSVIANKAARARDSSFSIDSDDDYFYSSPEDEEEFLTKEFKVAYDNLHVERLNQLSKTEIIFDYLQLESKYEKCLTEIKRLKRNQPESQTVNTANMPERKKDEGDVDTDTSSKCESEVSELLRVSQLENKTLKVELEELRKENKKLHSLMDVSRSSSSSNSSSSSSSVDSDSDSSSSSLNDSSDSEDNDVEMESENQVEDGLKGSEQEEANEVDTEALQQSEIISEDQKSALLTITKHTEEIPNHDEVQSEEKSGIKSSDLELDIEMTINSPNEEKPSEQEDKSDKGDGQQ